MTFSEVLQSGTKKLGLQYFVVVGLETNGLKEIIYPLMHNVPKWSHFKNLAVFSVRFLKRVRPFWEVMQ